MTDPSVTVALMSQQSRIQMTQQMAVQRSEEQQTARLAMRMADMQADRARKNLFRKEMNAILADAMTTLKKTSDQIKQSTGG